MNKITHELFMEWVEQYLDNTISPETSQHLLECLQQDPDRLETQPLHRYDCKTN